MPQIWSLFSPQECTGFLLAFQGARLERKIGKGDGFFYATSADETCHRRWSGARLALVSIGIRIAGIMAIISLKWRGIAIKSTYPACIYWVFKNTPLSIFRGLGLFLPFDPSGMNQKCLQ
ncbi:MAG: hypothetical protein V4805_18605 [Pseudomonadota bacterium]